MRKARKLGGPTSISYHKIRSRKVLLRPMDSPERFSRKKGPGTWRKDNVRFSLNFSILIQIFQSLLTLLSMIEMMCSDLLLRSLAWLTLRHPTRDGDAPTNWARGATVCTREHSTRCSSSSDTSREIMTKSTMPFKTVSSQQKFTWSYLSCLH